MHTDIATLIDGSVDRLRTELAQITTKIEAQAAMFGAGARDDVIDTQAAKTLLVAGQGIRSGEGLLAASSRCPRPTSRGPRKC